MQRVWIAFALMCSGCASVPYPPLPGWDQPRVLTPRPGGIFDQADFNRDGRLDRDEAGRTLARIANNFSEIDANRDGYVTYRELHRYLGVHRWETLEDQL